MPVIYYHVTTCRMQPVIFDRPVLEVDMIYQEFLDSYLTEKNFKVERFHELGRRKGLATNLVSVSLEKKQARYLISGSLASCYAHKPRRMGWLTI